MFALVSRFGFCLAFAATVLGAAPHAAGPHCGTGTDSHQSAGNHHQAHQEQNDTGPADQCPHCPPAECRRHTECAAAGDLTVIVGRTDAPAQVRVVEPRRHVDGAFSEPLTPPTPPPQRHS